MGLSVFYLAIIGGLILCQPIANPTSAAEQLKSLQTSNIATGPVQGLVAAALGVLFATGKPDDRKTSGEPKEDKRLIEDNLKQLEDRGREDNGDDGPEASAPSDVAKEN